MPSLGIGHRAGCTMSESRTHGSRWRRHQMCCRRVCGSTPGDWDSNNPVLALSLRRCRTTAYTSSAVPRFTNMLLSPRPFGSRSVVRLGVIYPELRPPLVAIPSVRDTAHTFASYGSRERDVMGHFHFASSTAPSPWTALRVRWVPLYYFPTLSLRAFALCAAFPRSDYYALFDCLQGLGVSSGSPHAYSPPSLPSLAGSPVFTVEDSKRNAVGGVLLLAPSTGPLLWPVSVLLSPCIRTISMCLAAIVSKVCQGPLAP